MILPISVKSATLPRDGEVAEWSMATVLKTVNPQGFVGSNPTLSARKNDPSTGCFVMLDFSKYEHKSK